MNMAGTLGLHALHTQPSNRLTHPSKKMMLQRTKDCPTDYRVVAYKCYNYNDDYYFSRGKSEIRYIKINGVEYQKGVTRNFQVEVPWAGGSLTRAKVFCASIDERQAIFSFHVGLHGEITHNLFSKHAFCLLHRM